jgi:hypothetical protein
MITMLVIASLEAYSCGDAFFTSKFNENKDLRLKLLRSFDTEAGREMQSTIQDHLTRPRGGSQPDFFEHFKHLVI